MNSQNQKKLIQNIGIGAVVLGVLISAYYIFVKRDSATVVSDTSSVVTPIEQSAITDNTQISNTLAQLNQLKQAIDKSNDTLKSPAFRSLKDFTVDIPPEPYGGRENPFAETPEKIKRDEEAKKASMPSVEKTVVSVVPAVTPSPTN